MFYSQNIILLSIVKAVIINNHIALNILVHRHLFLKFLIRLELPLTSVQV